MSDYLEYLDDTHPRYVYEGTWSTDGEWSGIAEATTLHHSQDPAAAVQLTFNGTGISIHSVSQPSSGNFSVTIDGVEYGDVNTWSGGAPPRSTVVWTAIGLDQTFEHLLRIAKTTNDTLFAELNPATPVSDINVDLIVIQAIATQTPIIPLSFSARLEPSTSVTTGSEVPTDVVPEETSGKSTVPIGGIVGGAIGGFLFIMLIAGTWFFYRRYRSRPGEPVHESGEMRSYKSTGIVDIGGGGGTLNSDPYGKVDTLAPLPFGVNVSRSPSSKSHPDLHSDGGHIYPYPTQYNNAPETIYEGSEAAGSWKDNDAAGKRSPPAAQSTKSEEEPTQWTFSHPFARGGYS